MPFLDQGQITFFWKTFCHKLLVCTGCSSPFDGYKYAGRIIYAIDGIWIPYYWERFFHYILPILPSYSSSNYFLLENFCHKLLVCEGCSSPFAGYKYAARIIYALDDIWIPYYWEMFFHYILSIKKCWDLPFLTKKKIEESTRKIFMKLDYYTFMYSFCLRRNFFHCISLIRKC